MKNVDVVYHCAATAHEGLSVFSPHIITNNIFQASVAVITAAIKNKGCFIPASKWHNFIFTILFG